MLGVRGALRRAVAPVGVLHEVVARLNLEGSLVAKGERGRHPMGLFEMRRVGDVVEAEPIACAQAQPVADPSRGRERERGVFAHFLARRLPRLAYVKERMSVLCAQPKPARGLESHGAARAHPLPLAGPVVRLGDDGTRLDAGREGERRLVVRPETPKQRGRHLVVAA